MPPCSARARAAPSHFPPNGPSKSCRCVCPPPARDASALGQRPSPTVLPTRRVVAPAPRTSRRPARNRRRSGDSRRARRRPGRRRDRAIRRLAARRYPSPRGERYRPPPAKRDRPARRPRPTPADFRYQRAGRRRCGGCWRPSPALRGSANPPAAIHARPDPTTRASVRPPQATARPACAHSAAPSRGSAPHP